MKISFIISFCFHLISFNFEKLITLRFFDKDSLLFLKQTNDKVKSKILVQKLILKQDKLANTSRVFILIDLDILFNFHSIVMGILVPKILS